MGLLAEDKKPEGISLEDAYTAIRNWYQAHSDLIRGGTDEYRARSKELILQLPEASALDELELRAVVTEVLMGLLEWGYHEADDKYKMGAYAHAALEACALDFRLSEDECDRLAERLLDPLLSVTKP
jgi:hypothetical protein